MEAKQLACPVCREACSLFDVVDFNKSCEEATGKWLKIMGVPVYYARCINCGFCFAPEFSSWSADEFAIWIYNDEYVLVDPDYIEKRPRANAVNLLAMFPDLPEFVKHLDYGGGNGLLANLLRKSNWNSISYDPLANKGVDIDNFGKFDLISAFEVFEHVPDTQKLISDLRSLLSFNGLILFSTLLSDGNICPGQRLNWWYASPRNGHISLYSRKSLSILAQNNNWSFGSFSEGFHAFFPAVPSWAAQIIHL
jgi:SAM-dependent methyltransferase